MSLHAAVSDLLSQLSTDEKIALLHQHQPAIERLGLSAFHTGTEALHGLSWVGTATVFPQPVGLAATWDPEFLKEVGDAVATEVRAKHAQDPALSLNVWAPVVNTLRHPLWGRGEEGYSEDPDLTAALAIGYARGLRGDHPTVWKTVPTLKHFLAYGNETDRATTSSHMPPQALHEYELPAFTHPVAAGCVGAVMPSYNLINGRPTHVSGELLRLLREHAPEGIAYVSDAQAPSFLVDEQRYFESHEASHAVALKAGLDSFTDNSEAFAPTVERVSAALEAGDIDIADIDRAVRNLLFLRARTGELTNEDPYGIGADQIDIPAHRALAREAVARSVVLLENDGALPLAEPRTIAVVGPFAEHLVHDWYSGTPPYKSLVSDAVRERYPNAEVRVASGADRIALRSRTHGRFLEVAGDGSAVSAFAEAATPATHFDLEDWGNDTASLRSVESGLLLTGAGRFLSASSARIGEWVAQETFRLQEVDGGVRIQHLGSKGWLRVQRDTLALVADGTEKTAEIFDLELVSDGLAAVGAACEGADVAIVALGNDPHVAGRETEDRPDMRVAAGSRELWHVAAEAADDAILAIVSSYPYEIGELVADANAAVWLSHGGQELGHGLVDVLSGDREPVGRLPQTWWASAADAGDLFDYDVVGSAMTYRYAAARPAYGLGHGLAYSPVSYELIELSEASIEAPAPTAAHTAARPAGFGGRLVARVTLANTGDRPVDELVAVYAAAPSLPVPAPHTRLAGWVRAELAPGERRTVEVDLDEGVLAVWDAADHAFRIQPGSYELRAGRSASEPAVRAALEVTGEDPGARESSLVDASAFHSRGGVVTSDRTRESGQSIEVEASRAEGWARYDRVDLAGASALNIEVARRALPSEAPATIRAEARSGGEWIRVTGDVEVPETGRYGWIRVTAPIAAEVAGPTELRLVLSGAARVSEFEIVRA
ncbi:sugar hydrolase [Microbacterium sorbitolivorans]|uniref:glycoside hydrolase family 3 N-terminal domain-containing protein n=1 Tax=Microbacterium sorbitolivorans TaxID=1867410 RepID=UPI0013B04F7E|nr:glycoside hydrolase family 3 N-terminal domain-containing protein [Microbacterium sorbitolivorans]GGF43071.1 sugar hydrolase [Microbacterium sorbitolivorans]